MSDTGDILFERTGALECVTLNRPKAMNALTLPMCLEYHKRLEDWVTDGAVRAVFIEGAGEKAFCAGGDVIGLYESGKAGTDYWRHFFRDEYRLNTAIHEFPKPYIAAIDGITMGGGVGVSVHGRYRIATERTVFAMPETGIGLFPDVGGSYFLPRLPGAAGMFLALTGERLKAADCLALGVATHFVPSERLADLKAALAKANTSDANWVDRVLKKFTADPGEAAILAHKDEIDTHFGKDRLREILASLEGGSEWAKDLRTKLDAKSPTSVAVAFGQMVRGRKLSFRGAMRMEYRIVNEIMTGHDFYEGVRALLINKDKAPKWKPARFADLSDTAVAAHFNEESPFLLDFERGAP